MSPGAEFMSNLGERIGDLASTDSHAEGQNS